jgi:hypothetical protein
MLWRYDPKAIGRLGRALVVNVSVSVRPWVAVGAGGYAVWRDAE